MEVKFLQLLLFFLAYLVFAFFCEALITQYEVSGGNWIKFKPEYSFYDSVEINQLLTLLEIRAVLSVIALINWLYISKKWLKWW